MKGLEDPSTQGNGYARVLLGAMGVALIAGGMVTIWLIVSRWPVAFLAATPGLALIGYGVALLLACGFYDDADVSSNRFGIPVVRVRPRRDGLLIRRREPVSPPSAAKADRRDDVSGA
jgi:hypothetical protein